MKREPLPAHLQNAFQALVEQMMKPAHGSAMDVANSHQPIIIDLTGDEPNADFQFPMQPNVPPNDTTQNQSAMEAAAPIDQLGTNIHLGHQSETQPKIEKTKHVRSKRNVQVHRR